MQVGSGFGVVQGCGQGNRVVLLPGVVVGGQVGRGGMVPGGGSGAAIGFGGGGGGGGCGGGGGRVGEKCTGKNVGDGEQRSDEGG